MLGSQHSKPIQEAWHQAYVQAYNDANSNDTSSDNVQATALASAQQTYNSADFTAQHTAVVGMNTRVPSDYLATQVAMAAQKVAWWSEMQPSFSQRTTDRNATQSSYASSVNSIEQARFTAYKLAARSLATGNRVDQLNNIVANANQQKAQLNSVADADNASHKAI